ncbi:MAG TPA: sigma-70 family RNA polymerase sigma factor [Candidatus Acidoferrum sp.]|nr:sigma-70 family RNA polymerase sigma factor [Candidatus Acidoferrum sp.]
MTDSEAVQALQHGDQRGLEALVGRHELRALRTAYHVTRDPESAKDVVADAFLSVFEHIDGCDPDRPFEPWLLRIVVNRAISITRRVNRYQKVLSLLRRAPEGHDPEAEVLRNELHSLLAEALRSLPAQERAALSLRYFLDLDEREIAKSLDWPLGTVKTRLHRGRAHLRKKLEADGGDLWITDAMEGD